MSVTAQILTAQIPERRLNHFLQCQMLVIPSSTVHGLGWAKYVALLRSTDVGYQLAGCCLHGAAAITAAVTSLATTMTPFADTNQFLTTASPVASVIDGSRTPHIMLNKIRACGRIIHHVRIRYPHHRRFAADKSSDTPDIPPAANA